MNIGEDIIKKILPTVPFYMKLFALGVGLTVFLTWVIIKYV